MRMTIKIKKVETGYICEADNGDLPFEGRVHATKAEALDDLDAAYKGNTWCGERTSRGYSIDID